MSKPKIAVIGSGISGLSAAWIAQDHYEVDVYEKDSKLGGHVHTVELKSPEGQDLAVDTGFIVCNDRNYPRLHQFFRELGVQVRNSDMSFGYWDQESNLSYSGRGIGGLLARPANLLNGEFYRTISDYLRFNRICQEYLRQGLDFPDLSLGEFLRRHQFSAAFVRHYLVPMGAAIWSTSNEEMLEFPCSVFLHFFLNHGLLSLKDRPQWQTVVGGSHSYVKKWANQFKGRYFLEAQISKILRGPQGVELCFADGSTAHYDHVILAVHADQILGLLGDATPREQELLGVWKFQKNRADLHRASRILPPWQRAHASWNFIHEKRPGLHHPVAVSYDMNRLQGLQSAERYLVSLNLNQELSEQELIKSIDYEHPTFNLKTLASRQALRELSGQNRTSFVGAWFHNGFHEDGIRSAVEMSQKDLGIEWGPR